MEGLDELVENRFSGFELYGERKHSELVLQYMCNTCYAFGEDLFFERSKE